MNDAHIKAMQAEDRTEVVHLLVESDPWKTLGYTTDDWNRIFCPLPQGRDSYVAELDGRVAGVALVKQKFLLGDYLELLGVAEWARHKGIGSLLLTHVEHLVFERTKNLFACVSDFNQPARDFYKKQGYQEIGPMPNFLIPGSAEILLRKTAGPARTST
ncbi:MAG: GNAT family N-acetyltransferase [Nitrospira sp.]|nr:GNAT family N-acetyltransferase [Nitrospira sp.]MBH0182091.1 GNAT family N-acetyltransferase [Nitrospira sp.]MBH0185807.1 GNAT family N-acetyltransferase [Nitrospira sp.]MBH0189327.1 GNAT family N-acetyltransferase [Nitrospira sp.]MBH0195749.1 GNAT family N-acetyltransferase [Nitrospira sp.]